jgi:hypothetical protein
VTSTVLFSIFNKSYNSVVSAQGTTIGGQEFQIMPPMTSGTSDVGDVNAEKQSLIPDLNLIPEPITNVFSFFSGAIEWLKNIPQNIYEFSLSSMTWIYEKISMVILQTPIWLFDNEWFRNTTLTFSLISVGLVTLISICEFVKQMVMRRKGENDKPLNLWTIAKRFFVASGVASLAPFLFTTAFKGLNFISDSITKLGGSHMINVATTNIGLLDGLLLLVFTIIMLVFTVPLLLQAGRRFFELVALGVTAPFALSAWVFKSYRHFFTSWWKHLKRLSLHQVVYAMFLFVVGLIIFGVNAPATFKGIFLKTITVIGGFYSMIHIPNFVSSMLDQGGGLDDFFKMFGKVKSKYDKSKKVLKKPIRFTRWVSNIGKPKVISHKSRMSRIHGYGR